MNPLYLFPLAMVVPVIVALVAFVPAYAGFFGALYVIYDKPDIANPIMPYGFDIFYVFSAYGRLFDHWSAHIASSNFMDFTLPLIGLPLLGIAISLFLSYKLISGLVNFFRMMTAV